MVWHDCLLTTNDEHLFTGEAWACAVGKEAMAGSFPGWICGWLRDAAVGAIGAGC